MPLIPPKILKKVTGAVSSVAGTASSAASSAYGAVKDVNTAYENLTDPYTGRGTSVGNVLSTTGNTVMAGFGQLDRAKDLPLPTYRDVRGYATGEDYSSFRDAGNTLADPLEGIPVVGGPAASGVRAVVDPLMLAGLPLRGTGLAANLLGPGTGGVKAFTASVIGGAAASRAAEQAGLPLGVQLAAGLVGGGLPYVRPVKSTVKPRSTDVLKDATRDPSWTVARDYYAGVSGRTPGVMPWSPQDSADDITDPAVRALLGLDNELDITSMEGVRQAVKSVLPDLDYGSSVTIEGAVGGIKVIREPREYGGTYSIFDGSKTHHSETLARALEDADVIQFPIRPGAGNVRRAMGTDDLGEAAGNQQFTDVDRGSLAPHTQYLDMDDVQLEVEYRRVSSAVYERMSAADAVARGETVKGPEMANLRKEALRKALDLEVGEKFETPRYTVFRNTKDEWEVTTVGPRGDTEYFNSAGAASDYMFPEGAEGAVRSADEVTRLVNDAITQERTLYDIMVKRGLRAPRGGAENSALDQVWRNMRMAGEAGFDTPDTAAGIMGNTGGASDPSIVRAAQDQLLSDMKTHEALRTARWRTDGLATAREAEVKAHLSKLRTLTKTYADEHVALLDEVQPLLDAGNYSEATSTLEFLLNSVHDGIRRTEEGFLVDLNAGLPLFSFKRRPGPLAAGRPTPIGDAFYEMDNMKASAARLKRDNPGAASAIQDALRKVHADSLGSFVEPVEAAASAKRGGNILPQAIVDYDLFKSAEKAAARAGLVTWIAKNRRILGLDSKGFARGVVAKRGITINPKAYQRLDDIMENMHDYVGTTAQVKALLEIHDTYQALIGAQIRAGVPVPQVDIEYFARIVTKSPKSGEGQRAAATYLASKKGHQKMRRFSYVREGIDEGYEYANPIQAMMSRLEAGIDTVADRALQAEITPLGESVASRVSYQAKADMRAANAQMKAAGKDPVLIAVAQVELARAKDALKQAAKAAAQPHGYEQPYNGFIFPEKVIDELQKYVDIMPGGGNIDNVSEFFNLQRSSMIIGDLSQFFVQGTSLMYRNNIAWWKAVGYSLASLVSEPWDYVGKNSGSVSRGVAYGAISPPAEFLLRSSSRGGPFGRASYAISKVPGISQLQRSFEWFAFVGQTEMWKAQEGMYPRMTETEAKAAASAVRKMLGVVHRPGLTKNQRRLQSMVFFAPSFRASFVGLMKDAASDFTSPAGVEARKTIASVIAGSAAITYAGSLAINGEPPNLTDPTEKSWFGIRVNDGYFYPLGPWHTWFKTIASASHHANEGDFEGLLDDATFLARGGSGIEGGAIVDFMLGEDVTGKPVNRTAAGIALYFLSGVGPIGPKQVLEPMLPKWAGGTDEGLLGFTDKGIKGFTRFPARIAEVAGGRTTPLTPSELREETVETKGIPLLQSMGHVPYRDHLGKEIKEIDQLWFGEYDAALRDLRKTDPDLAEAVESKRREFNSVLQEKEDRRTVISAEYAPDFERLNAELLSKTGRPPSEIIDELRTIRTELNGRTTELYDDPKYRAAIKELTDKFGENDGRVLLNNWFQIFKDVKGEKHALSSADWDVIEARQEKFLAGLPAEVRARFETNMEIQDSRVESHPIVKLKKEVDNESKDYYDLPEVNRAAYLVDHPEVDVARWVVYGGKLGSVAAVDLALSKSSNLEHTGAAIKNSTRDVYFEKFPRPINDAPELWHGSKAALDWYFNTVIPAGKQKAVLKKRSDINGILAFFGYNVELHTTASKNVMSKLITEYTDWGDEWTQNGAAIMWWMNLSNEQIKGNKAKGKVGAAVTRPDVDAVYAYYREVMFKTPPVLYTAEARPFYALVSGKDASKVPVRAAR